MDNSFLPSVLNENLTAMYKDAIQRMSKTAMDDARDHLGCDLGSMLPITEQTTILELVMLNFYLSSQMSCDIDPIKLAGAKVYSKHIELTQTVENKAEFFASFIEPVKHALEGDEDAEELIAELESAVINCRHGGLSDPRKK